MVAGPIGQGEKKHPIDGNAVLITSGGGPNGANVGTPLWLSAIATDLNMQIDTAQVHGGLVHRPIRMLERMVMFSALWNVKDRPKYLKLIKDLQAHWALNLTESGAPTPMKLLYFGANKKWYGFIEAASVSYMVTDVILSYQFQMRIMPTSDYSYSQLNDDYRSPFLPTAHDIKNFGGGWYHINDYIREFGIDNSNRRNGGNPVTKDPTDPGGGAGGKKHG